MYSLTEIVPDVHRLTIPFENIYTTVFIIKTPAGAVLLDTATYESDVDAYILPALAALSIPEEGLRYIVLSHSHRDHAGGLERLMEFFPKACIVSGSPSLLDGFHNRSTASSEEQPLPDCMTLISVPGHAPDCLALFDQRSRTLLTGDSLQLYGIYGSGKWGANISRPAEHLRAVEELRALDARTVIASHDYHPCGYIARGAEEIGRYLDECGAALRFVHSFLLKHADLDDQSAADSYNRLTGLPAIGAHVVTAVRAAAKDGVLRYPPTEKYPF